MSASVGSSKPFRRPALMSSSPCHHEFEERLLFNEHPGSVLQTPSTASLGDPGTTARALLSLLMLD